MSTPSPSSPEANIKRVPSSPVSIDVDKLGKKFNREWIFRNLSFSFQPGTIYAVTGPNGSGKSTLLQVLWGQMPPSSGALKYHSPSGDIAGEDIFRNVSIATPYMDLIDEFTLLEQLRFHFRLKPLRVPMTEDELLEKIGLSHARDKFIANFSSGMKQRVKLALAFFSQSDILFLDEPGTNLDSRAFDWYLQQLAAVPAQALVFIASNQSAEYPSNARKLDIMGLK